MKEIKLTNSHLIALVDDEDFERVSKYKWRFQKDHKHRTYFTVRGSIGRKEVYLHRFVLDLGKTSLVVDHIDRNTLNNQKSNLRLVTQRENVMNSARKEKGLQFIYIKQRKHKHTLSFTVESKSINIKSITFDNYEDALLARDKLMLEHFGANCLYIINDVGYILSTPHPKESAGGGEIARRVLKGIGQPDKRTYERPSIEEIHKLVWSKSTAGIAEDIGCSDKCVEKWCKFNNIPKPPRGFWQQIRVNKMLGQCCPLPV
jgi:hypothetical protein